jgi:hypothetical protein
MFLEALKMREVLSWYSMRMAIGMAEDPYGLKRCMP